MRKSIKLMFNNKTRNKNNKNNKTKKINYKIRGNEMIMRKDCDVGLKYFEKKYQKEFKTDKLYKLSYKEFTELLLSKVAPSSIKPYNDYYSYINYKWFEYTTQPELIQQISLLENARKYIMIILIEYKKKPL